MSTRADTTPDPVSIEQAEEASACLGEQVERVRQVVSDYLAVTAVLPCEAESG